MVIMLVVFKPYLSFHQFFYFITLFIDCQMCDLFCTCDGPEEPHEVSHRSAVFTGSCCSVFMHVHAKSFSLLDVRRSMWSHSVFMCVFFHMRLFAFIANVYFTYCHVNLLTMYFPIIKS